MAKAVFGLVDSEVQAERTSMVSRPPGFPITTFRSCSPINQGQEILRMSKIPNSPKGLRQVPAQGEFLVECWLACGHRLIGYSRRRTLYCCWTDHGRASRSWGRRRGRRAFGCFNRIGYSGV